ncbi:restriction endonuclease [Helicobacter pylori]|uniref:restriction endonuclease n=1 Tax=Helicobacter pylori TaxID=210 RepID=UPI0009BC879E|nr:restriction endonuclease [Helicobacter pylori]KAF0999012.1 restriction endonuclease [Helicobacter pylori 10700]AQM65683.1 Type II restriction enzyme, similar to HpyUMO37,MjaIV prototype [Helicobacter pylori SS1]AQM72135.1 Type II restriction enzyme, similar to HpyUMO37,MjaIV prototype [Helicobacter pylori PMSS1]KAF0999034.1 restriction endonuclease [Helicobacter pylori SS1]KAF1000750.1 restriction endonuclease [Helicobacter pylori SS1_190]
MIPTQLNEIAEFLKTNPYHLSQPLQDGRLNSSVNEEEILNTIKDYFPIQLPKAREWWDFSFKKNDIFYPVNIKTTTTKTADNLNGKLGIYYALCDLVPTFNNEIAWEKYFQKLHKDLGKNTNRDYYFLIINKNDPKDVFINSLKGIQTLQPNNLPFQCKWDNNREIVQRNFTESKNFILSALAKSVKLRANIY